MKEMRRPKNPERAHTGMGRTHKLHTEKPKTESSQERTVPATAAATV